MNNFNHCGGGFPAFGNHHDKPFDGEQKGLGKIFYKSDFSVWLADPTGDKTTPFTLTFYVGDLESTYTAGFDGLDYKRCKRNEDGSLLVFFDRHALPCGRLMLRVEIDKADPDYGDGEQNTADKLPLPIILWDGATSYEPTMAYALAPYIVGADGKPFTYEDLTEEEKKDLGEKATAELAATVQRSYNAADKEAMEAIEDPKEGDMCVLESGENYTYHNGEWVLLTDPMTAEEVEEIVDAAVSVSGFTILPTWVSGIEDGNTYTAAEIEELGGSVEELKKLLDKGKFVAYDFGNGYLTACATQKDEYEDGRVECLIWRNHYVCMTVLVYTIYSDNSIKCEVGSAEFATASDLEAKADVATTPALLTAADADAMNALTTAKDGDRCIVGGNAIYDRVGGKWYFTAGVQPPKVIKASELKAGDKIKTVNFDTSKTPAATSEGIFCTIGGIQIEMLAFLGVVSYGTGKTSLFMETWNTANTAACSAAMAGKTVDSVAASMVALSANVDDWLSFEIE